MRREAIHAHIDLVAARAVNGHDGFIVDVGALCEDAMSYLHRAATQCFAR